MHPSGPHLIVEPDDGLDPVCRFIASAQSSLQVKQFTFTDETLVQAVIERKSAGVAVRVMLNAARSGGDRANDATFAAFQEAGIDVQWANPKFYVTHEKSIVVDEKSALVATFNLCLKYFTATRDYGVIIDDPKHVAQIVEVFNADWNHDDWAPPAYEGLLWSNSNSRLHMARFIDTATRSIDVQHPKFVDAVILDHLAAAVDRGVRVHVLCGGKHGISEWDILDTFASLRTLRRFGAKVHKQKNLRVHAKLLIVDDERALLGSMNIDRSAFDLRRELGVEVSDPAVVARLKAVFLEDWDLSHHYAPPDPLDPSQHHEDDFPTITNCAMSEAGAAPAPAPERVSLLELAWTFNHIALASFGGGLSAWSREVIVVEKKWMGDAEFLSAMTMCRILPGANQVNMAVFVGTKMRAIPGAVASIVGLCLMPMVFVLAMSYVYFRFKEVPAVKGVLHGASAAAVALTLTMVIKTGQKALTGLVPIALFGAAFVLNGLLRWPLLGTLAVLAPLSLIWAWPRGDREAAQA